MNNPKDGGPAFPRTHSEAEGPVGSMDAQKGMTLRDWFAGQAISGLTANARFSNTARDVERLSYEIADAMIEEKAKREKREQ